MAREEKIIIRVSEEMKNSFQGLAEEMGMTMSALGSFVIGNYMKQEKYNRAMQEKMIESLSPQLAESMVNIDLEDPRLSKVIGETFTKIAAQNRP